MLEAIDAGVPTGFQKLAAPVDREIAAEAMGMERPDSVKETWLTNALWQLGTLGGGNHFLEVQRDEAGQVFVSALGDAMTGRAPRKRYWNEPRMGLRERVYIIEVLRGLAHHRVGLLPQHVEMGDVSQGRADHLLPRGAAQRLFAEQPGTPRPDAAPNGEVQCVSCNLCATACPAYCIEILSSANFDDPAHPKAPERFEIDYSRCIFCGFCVEACPEDAIRMVKDVPDLPGFDRTAMWEDGPPDAVASDH